MKQGLAVYCGEEGGEHSAAPLLQILSEFAATLERAVKKYDEKIEAEKRKVAKKKKTLGNENEKEKENRQVSRGLLKASSLQPHVGVTDRVKKKSADATPKQENASNSGKESRVFLVNRMLSEAPDSVKKGEFYFDDLL